MKDSKLVYFLQRLSKEELKDFKAFVDSPLFNRRNSLKTLLSVLIKSDLSKGPLPSKEEVYSQVYGDQPFNERSFRTLLAQMFSLLRQFMAFCQYRNDEVQQQLYFLEKLNGTLEEKYFPGYLEKARNAVSTAEHPSSDRHLQLMFLEENNLLYQLRRPARLSESNLDQAGHHLLAGFLLRLLRYELQQINLAGKFKVSAEHSILRQELIASVKDQLADLPVEVQVYSNLLQLFRAPEDPVPFFLVRESLSSSWEEFSRSEGSEIYTLSLNYCARMINRGQLNFLEQAFELYVEMLDRALITVKGQLSPYHYKNIISVALRLERFDWAQKFIEDWRELIYPDHAQNAFHFNQGIFHFFRGEFYKASRFFHTVLQDFKDLFYEFDSKGYLLQIYYETGDTRSLEALAHSFRVKLGRSEEISDATREQYLSFIRGLMRLLNIPLNDKERLQKLKDNVLEKPRKGMGFTWLVDKIDALLAQ